MHGTASLTVEAHNFSEGLGNDHLESSAQEVSETLSILVEVASDEALVSSVEEGIELVGLANVSDHFPLLEGGVDAGGVVGTGVEENDGSGGGVLEILNHTIEIQSLSLLMEISVLSNLETSLSKHSVVVAPSRVRNVDG